MDFLKTQLDRIKQQLAGLSPSQKMLSAALVVIMVMTLWWWARYAGSPELEPLLDQTLTKDDISRIDAQLTAANIDHKVTNDGKVMVAPDRRLQALAGLGYANLLPKNMASGWDETVKQLTAWDGQDRQNAVFNRAKEVSLERVISLFPGVASASVFIDPQFKRVIGNNAEPTANVTLQLKDGASNLKQLAVAAANMVSGAQSGITPGRVKVIINGRLVKVEDANATAESGITAEGLIETQLAAENLLTQKLERHLSYIDGVRVAVAVQVSASSQNIQDEEYDQKKSVQLEQETETKTTEDNNSGANTPLEAGVVPNSGDNVAANPGGGGTNRNRSDNMERTRFVTGLGKRTTVTREQAGKPVPVGASVRVPRSHFVLVAKGGDPNAKEPDAATLDKIIGEEIPRIRKDVIACTAIKGADDAITVEPYADVSQFASRNAAVATTSSVAGMLGGHVKEIALGGLALASLFMMSMIVRKGTPPAAVVAPVASSSSSSAAVTPAVLAAGETLAGEVTEGNPLLEGMELDDDSIKTQQMLSQVTNMVGENPDAAATLIKRWMNQR